MTNFAKGHEKKFDGLVQKIKGQSPSLNYLPPIKYEHITEDKSKECGGKVLASQSHINHELQNYGLFS